MRAVLAAVVVLAAVAYGAPARADEVRDTQWHLDALAVGEAHRYSLGDGVTVAVLDSGVDASHPDLRDNVLPGVDLTGRGGDGRDDAGGSGTALAGLIAGHGHTAPVFEATEEPEQDPEEPDPEEPGEPPAVAPDGVLGLAPRATVLPVVVTTSDASPEADTLAAGIDAAVRHGADVICIGRPVPQDPVVTQALGAAVDAGLVVVVPGGSGSDALARYGDSGVLGAAPAGTAGTAGAVEVPAAGVLSTGGQGGYYRYDRTAEAAASAVLAGAAALVRAAHPELAGHQVGYRVEATADQRGLALVAALTAPVEQPAPTDPATAGPRPADPDAVPASGPEREPRVAAFDSGDWRRWLVATPLVVFLGGLAGFSIGAARRARG